MMVKAILFDLDGTLRDTMEVVYRAMEQTVTLHNGKSATREDKKPHVHHHSAVHAALSP